MNRKHDAVYGGIGGDLGDGTEPGAGTGAGPEREADRGPARFLKRSTALGDRLGGGLEEKTLHWVDPEDCVMWERHNRAYELLTEDRCRDLIDGIRAQGRQEFPAVVRRTTGQRRPYEVICGARRHFAVRWLRAHGYTQFRYLVEVRDLTDEEAFRLADVENRDRQDISDFERARDYAQAVAAYYGGSQKAMAERMEVTQTWLSRYLALARLPQPVIDAFASIRDLREVHARQLAPMLRGSVRGEVMGEARRLADLQTAAREGRGEPVDAACVLAALRAKGSEAPKRRAPRARTFRRDAAESGLKMLRRGSTIRLELRDDVPVAAARAWLEMFLEAEYGDA